MTLWQAFECIRRHQGLTRREMSKRSGISVQSLCYGANRKKTAKDMRVLTARAMAKALNVSIEYASQIAEKYEYEEYDKIEWYDD